MLYIVAVSLVSAGELQTPGAKDWMGLGESRMTLGILRVLNQALLVKQWSADGYASGESGQG